MNLLFWYRSLMRSVGATLVKLIATATSGLVSFTTNVIRPVKVICEFIPVQEGTGDPSPDNVRPISGWTGCEISHGIPFDFTNEKANSYINNNGEEKSQNGFSYTIDYTPVVPGETYYIRWKPKTAGNINLGLYYYNEDKTFVGRNSFLQSSADFALSLCA